MTQHYFDPQRAADPHALPDGEVFYLSAKEIASGRSPLDFLAMGYDQGQLLRADGFAGWYWWACFPGCLPDGDPIGPFETEQEAIADAQSGIIS